MNLKTYGFGILTMALISCGSEVQIGDGKNLDTLSLQPTGVELASATLYGGYRAGTTLVSDKVEQTGTHRKESTVLKCSNGGTMSSQLDVDTSCDAGTFQVTFSNCQTHLEIYHEGVLVGNPLTETYDGSLSLVATSRENSKINVGLSLSGDLGLKVTCDLTNFFSQANPSGECDFEDHSGKIISATAADLIAGYVF